MRVGPREVAARRQREMFGVDGLERALADCVAEVIRACDSAGIESVHVERMKAWLLGYEDKQGSEWNGVPR